MIHKAQQLQAKLVKQPAGCQHRWGRVIYWVDDNQDEWREKECVKCHELIVESAEFQKPL